jgi:hypothetical protein
MKAKARAVDQPNSLIQARVDGLLAQHSHQSEPVLGLEFKIVRYANGDFPPAVNQSLAALGGGLEPFDQRGRFLGIIDFFGKGSPRPAAERAREGVRGERSAWVREESIESRGDVVVFPAACPFDRAFQPFELGAPGPSMKPVGADDLMNQAMFGPIARLKIVDRLLELALKFLSVLARQYQTPRANPIL